MKQSMRFFVVLIFCAGVARADGLIVPSSKQYPKDFLRNRMTSVTVAIHGAVAETIVYQEFVNEWNRYVDGVYCFPLPADARATAIYYWRNDSLFQAVLKVQQQSGTPGTGDGGVAASVNSYLGLNGIKLELKGMLPNAIQKVQIHYIQTLDYSQGEYLYRFPLAAKDFIQYPREQVSITLNVVPSADIVSFRMPTHPEYHLTRQEPRFLSLDVDMEKMYATQDFEFRYAVDAGKLGVDFFSTANDTADGHYALFLYPPAEAAVDSLLPKRIIFLIGSSSRMYGVRFEQSVTAVCAMLDLLGPQDQFNVISFNSSCNAFQSQIVPATAANLVSAKTWVSRLSAGNGSRLDLALQSALAQFPDREMNNAVLAFTDGRSPVDPRDIAARNVRKAGIFLVGIGDDLERSRMEMTAEQNYGFVRYFKESDDLGAGMLRLFKTIDRPLMQNVLFELGTNVYATRPVTLPSIFAGSCFMSTGRYRSPGPATFTVIGRSRTAWAEYDFRVEFDGTKTGQRWTEFLWAKMMLDGIEREIDVYGERPALKDSAIAISLAYGIRCRYTAYIADYKDIRSTDVTPESSAPASPASCLLGNYPNPFNPTTTIRFRIDASALKHPLRVIRIYDLLGRLVAEFDVSRFAAGNHTIVFDGRDALGRQLPSGAYLVRLIAGEESNTLKIVLMK